MKAYYAAIATLVVSLAAVAIAALVSSRRSPTVAPEASTAAVYRTRSLYFYIILAAAVVALAVTLPVAPYPSRVSAQHPDLTVKVVGQMWSWIMTPVSGAEAATGALVLPAGKLVEFEVTSQDVNHNFGIYDADGVLVAQVQAMPGYTNHLFHTFDKPGRYYVLCLEYCGVAHHVMTTTFEVQ